MCGIVGIVAKDCKRYEEILGRMIGVLHHRGPDDCGKVFFKNCALGHTRLSIIDIDSGNQPMKSPVSEIAITFNGEIYGYKDIRQQFEDYPFRTKSDTEIILALYDKYGKDLLKTLPGMFSFAIWDPAQERLFCARDRFGEKPFYYAFGNNGEFIFASEIKAIIASGLVKPCLNISALDHYLRFKYVNPRQCIYKNISTLPPAHYLVYRDCKLTVKRYWELPETLKHKITFKEAADELKRLLKKSVRKQLVADVPVSAFLSGGLDSSSIVILAKEVIPDITTFSFGFENSPKNELPYAREIAALCNTNHIELFDSDPNLADLLIEMQSIFDEPFSDSSNIPTYLISKEAAKHTKAVISGDGGDELLAGYREYYMPLYNLSEYIKLNDVFSFFLKMWLLSIREFKNKKMKTKINRQLEFLRCDKKRETLISEMHYKTVSTFSAEQLVELGLNQSNNNNIPDLFSTNSVDDALRIDLLNYLPGDILVKTDRASMANSLEIRAPFLDLELAEFCISLPIEYKIDGKNDKLIMRECFKKQWPRKIANRSKQGFGAPLEKWIDQKGFKDLRKEFLSDHRKKIFMYLSYDKVQNLIINNPSKLWSLLTLSVWMEAHSLDA